MNGTTSQQTMLAKLSWTNCCQGPMFKIFVLVVLELVARAVARSRPTKPKHPERR